MHLIPNYGDSVYAPRVLEKSGIREQLKTIADSKVAVKLSVPMSITNSKHLEQTNKA